MKNPDEAIDKVLAGLRDVEAPAGLERRVLAAMEERATARSGWWPAAGWVVGFGVAAMVVAGVLVVRSPRLPGERVAVRSSVAVPARTKSVQKRNTGVLTVTEAASGPLHPVEAASFHSVQNDVHFRGVQRVPQIRQVEVAGVEQVEQERGFPAPPMPLTNEEKLLLRVAHRVDPQQLTPLNAEARARQEAEFDAEFLEFFAVPEFVADEKQADPTEEATTENDKGEAR